MEVNGVLKSIHKVGPSIHKVGPAMSICDCPTEGVRSGKLAMAMPSRSFLGHHASKTGKLTTCMNYSKAARRQSKIYIYQYSKVACAISPFIKLQVLHMYCLIA
jgi:hypothetical protein